MIRFTRNFSIVAAIVLLTACGRGGDEQAFAAETPDGAVLAMASALKTNDIEGFLRRALSQADYEAAREEWNAARAGAISEQDRESLNAALAALADDDLVDELMAEFGPVLESARPNLPLMLMAAQTMGHASISANEKLSETQKNAANELLGALGKWAGGRDLANPELARTALSQWVADAREIDLKTASDLQALEFEEMVARAGILMAATRDVLRVYELNLGAVFDSTTAEVVRQQGDTALVRVHFLLLDTKQQFDVVMSREDGRWLPESLLSEQLRMHKAAEREPTTT